MLSTREAVEITSFCIGKTYSELIEVMKRNCNNFRNIEEEEIYKGNLINKKAVEVDYHYFKGSNSELFEIKFEELSTHWSGLNLVYKDGKLVEVFRGRYS